MIKKKTVLVTGASRGIGRAVALAFSRGNYNVIINYNKSEEAARALEREILLSGGSCIVCKADVSKKKEIVETVENSVETFEKIDVLVNNAGIAQQKLFTDITNSDWEKMFDVNVGGVFHSCQAVLPGMISRHEGKIINISSIWGMVGASCEVHYSAAKAAIIGLTKALAKEVGPSNIQVNCVAPGIIQTDMNADIDEAVLSQLKEETPLGKIGTPEQVAQTVLFLASDAADFITGQVISPNGGFVV